MTATIGRATVTASAPADARVLALAHLDHRLGRGRHHRLEAGPGPVDANAALLHETERFAAARRQLRISQQLDDVDLTLTVLADLADLDVPRLLAILELLAERDLRLVRGRG